MPRNKAQELAVQQAEAQVEIIETQDNALAPYMDGVPYNKAMLLNQVEFYYRQHASSAFEIGKRLIVLKAHSEHGTFTANVLESVGISPAHASGLMAFARTVIETSGTSNGKIDLDKLAAMDHRKVLMLGEIARQDPEELEETGRIGGRTIDEWDAKSRKEIKAEMETLRDKLEMRREELAGLNEKLVKERDKVDALLSATPNAVTESVTRLGKNLRDAIASFEATATCDEDLEPDSATILDLVGLRAELRTFFDQLFNIIEDRFPAVLLAEVPTDLDLTAAPPTAKINQL